MEQNKKEKAILLYAFMIPFICGLFFEGYFYVHHKYRERALDAFINCNNHIPDEELDTIDSPKTYAISFDQYYHIDSFYIYNKEGELLIKQGTPFLIGKGTELKDINAYNYAYISPFSLNMNSHNITTILTIEQMLKYPYSIYDINHQDLLEYLYTLSKAYQERIFVPSLNMFFDRKLFIRPHKQAKSQDGLTNRNEKSIIRSLTLNKIGKIDSVYLYNDEAFCFFANDTIFDGYVRAYTNNIDFEQFANSYEKHLNVLYINKDQNNPRIIALSHMNKALYQLTHYIYDILIIKKKTSPSSHQRLGAADIPKWINLIWIIGAIIGIVLSILLIITIKSLTKEEKETLLMKKE